MNQIYNCKDELSQKSDEELFHIYLGYPHQRPNKDRYLAARILEGRDFQFKQTHHHLLEWNQAKYARKGDGKFRYHFKFGQNDLITILMFLAIIFLSIVVIVPVFFPNSTLAFSFSGDIWFFLNVLSFVVFFYIFGFIGYISKAINNLKKQKRTFEVFHQHTS